MDLMKDLFAMVLIGDGALSFARPKRHVWLWQFGPEGYREAMEKFAENPGFTRAVAAAEIGLGLWLARRTEEK